MERKVIIRWATKESASITAIRKRFKIPNYTTLNGWSPGTINDEDREVFEECARRGFFSYREVEWQFNGLSYSW